VAGAFDVIVVGARCAGAPLATMLARAGVSVCLLDKDRFPSDTLSTHAIQPTGVQVLERIGVLERLLAVAPPIVRGRMVFDDDVAVIDDIPAITGAPVVNVRRVVLDEILVEAAGRAGADVRTHTSVTGLVSERGRVAGVTTATGELRAQCVIGADGTRSVVAAGVGAREYQQAANGRVFMWAYYDGDPTGGEMWIGKLDDYAYLAMPTDGGLSLVGACPSILRRDEVRADREAVYAEGVRAWPQLHAGVARGRREGALHTMANMHGYFRASAGRGWALVGDAGHFKDPTPGQGIADALRQAERMAPAIVRGLGAGTLDLELRDWWRWRDDDAWEMYWFAHDLGAAGPTPPVLREVQRRVAGDDELLAATMRVFNHELRPSQVYTPAFTLTTVAQALRHGRGQRREILREVATAARDEVRRRRAKASLV